jgi:single-strand DNA-binding protein
MINTVVLVGRSGRDAELRYFETGSVKASFAIAVDRSFSRENKETDWFEVEAWGKLAEFCGEWVKKGTSLVVSGQLEAQRWQDPAGNTREKLLVKAVEIKFAASKREQSQAGDMAAVGSY